MTHATNIGQMHARKNGKTMTGKSQEHEDAYRLQLESEQRYAIGKLPELNENVQSSENQKIYDFMTEELKLDLQETDISLVFGDFIREKSKTVAKKINQIWERNRSVDWQSKTSNFRSWDDVRNWDRTVLCPFDGCEQRIVRTRASNNKKMWERTNNLIKKILGKPHEAEASKIIKIHGRKDIRFINFDAFRKEMGKRFGLSELFQNSEDVYVPNNDVDAEKYGVQFDDSELFNLFHVNKAVYSAMLHMNYCYEVDTCCPGCGGDLWKYTPSFGEIDGDPVFFESMAESALKALISGLLGSDVGQPNKSFKGRIVDFRLPEQIDSFDISKYTKHETLVKDIRQGTVDEYLDAIIQIQKEKANPDKSVLKAANLRKQGMIVVHAGNVKDGDFEWNRHKAAIAEGFQACFEFADHNGFIFESPSGEKIQFKDSDNRLSECSSILSMNALNKMGAELMKFKPLFFFTEDQDEFPLNKQHEWAKKLASQILRVIIDMKSIIRVHKIKPANRKDENYKHEMYMIEFKSSFLKELTHCFACLESDNSRSFKRDLVDYFNTKRVDPMFVQPLERTIHHTEGGFLTKNAQLKNPLIQNNMVESLFNVKRFEPSQQAIDNLNRLQRTAWKINPYVGLKSQEILNDFITKFVQKFNLSHSDYGLQLDFKGAFPEYSLSQIREWTESIWLANYLNGSGSGKFWHAWSFDWRGRMYTCSNLLSPQGDDLARGLIQFAEELPLDDNGWKWLRRAVAISYRGRKIPEKTDLFTEKEKGIWNDIQLLLQPKDWKSVDKIFSDEKMIEMFNKVMENVTNDPAADELLSIWGEDDIFKKKAEGFQRLALTEAYHHAMCEFELGEQNPVVSIPVVLDASSNIYQHASCLTQDAEMALSVNVLPNSNKTPNDVYQKVANRVKEMWADENPLASMNLETEVLDGLMDFALARSAAKKPVMTIGYGSKEFGIVSPFLTHNGEKGGINQWAMFHNSDNSKLSQEQVTDLWEQYPEKKGSDKAARDKIAKYRMVAHRNSILGRSLEEGRFREDIPHQHHHFIAEIIVDSFTKAIDAELNGHSVLKDSLERVRWLQATTGNNDYVSWTLNDGSKINNIVYEKMNDKESAGWSGTTEETKGIRFTIKIHSEERSNPKEASGLPPNFVHSIDACHMRAFVEEFSQSNSNPVIDPDMFLWSVHDAFGSHPNFIDRLSEVATKTFFEVHESLDGISHLHTLIQQTLTTCPPPKGNADKKKYEEFKSRLEKVKEDLGERSGKVSLELLDGFEPDEIFLIS
jgi:hypothetical protein